ncbi:MAG: radical SAM protein [Tenuifilaceae bacterium]|jgi:wyosine [tRNA(Phe)-imidazoG37] synthetase (radical SAM superfamily)|nr:radical SAM protein [Tenuifilaceae bacterium]
MATFLFDEIIFGPVRSRRLGISLGVNLLPTTTKVCSFDCIYCECGWTQGNQTEKLPTRELVRDKMVERFESMKAKGEELDVITFAGNGEPTLHPNFEGVIDDTIELRNKYFPSARIAVLSNSTMLHKPSIVKSLLKIDQNILKLDSGFDETIQLLNQPHRPTTAEEVIKHLEQFDGNFILQTMFVRGSHKGRVVNNTTDAEVDKWLSAVKRLMPKEIMIYTIARDTPADTLSKVPVDELEAIATKARDLGIPVQVSG